MIPRGTKGDGHVCTATSLALGIAVALQSEPVCSLGQVPLCQCPHSELAVLAFIDGIKPHCYLTGWGTALRFLGRRPIGNKNGIEAAAD